MDYNKKAFSLTELLIVLVVLAVLFAALAPIITKRRSGAGYSNETVWNFVNSDDQRNSFFDPGMHNMTSAAYVGYDPTTYPDGAGDFNAKMVIRAKTGQRQIQFRYGDGYGVNTGSLFIDNNGNISLGDDNNSLVSRSAISNPPTNNTIAGMGAGRRFIAPGSTVSYGALALGNTTGSSSSVIVGNMAGSSLTASPYELVALGSSVARTTNSPNYSVLVGAKTATSPSYSGLKNVYAGAGSGSGEGANAIANYNVVLGSKFFGYKTSNNYNTIVGYGNLEKGQPRLTNITSVGGGDEVCASISGYNTGGNGSRTCIGYYTAAASNAAKLSGSDPYSTDIYDHIFIGGQPFPLKSFPGRAVLEVHNQRASTLPSGNYNPTVIMNSNIVVRGNLFLANYNFPNMNWLSQKEIDATFLDLVNNDDHCRRWGGMFGRKQWRTFASWRHDEPWSKSMLQWEGNYRLEATSYRFENTGFMPKILNYSDIRLKENITDNNDGLDYIAKLMPYNYVYKNDEHKTPQVGVMAQDLEKVFKNSVTVGKDGYLRIRWDEMFYATINSIKALNSKLEKITIDLSNIETDVKYLKADHKNLKKRIAVLNARASKLEKK